MRRRSDVLVELNAVAEPRRHPTCLYIAIAIAIDTYLKVKARTSNSPLFRGQLSADACAGQRWKPPVQAPHFMAAFPSRGLEMSDISVGASTFYQCTYCALAPPANDHNGEQPRVKLDKLFGCLSYLTLHSSKYQPLPLGLGTIFQHQTLHLHLLLLALLLAWWTEPTIFKAKQSLFR